MVAVFALDYRPQQQYRRMENDKRESMAAESVGSSRRYRELERRMVELELRLARYRASMAGRS